MMNGYADGTFGPNDTLTRGQFVSVLDRLGLLE
ncbi:S-layer homology domain-containing protein [Mangrovibacillus cuniculi]